MALRQHFTILTRLPARIAAYKQAENAASVLVDATRKSVIGGERINLDVLNAWSQLYNVRSDLARARHDWLLAWVSLHFYAGTLDDDKLRWLAAQFVEPAEVSGAHKTHRRELALR
ncbi:TolC family protein [Apirhabdus apintestini]|nr:TolC family protein [Enterobacteriaceae bacterium CA-0114]